MAINSELVCSLCVLNGDLLRLKYLQYAFKRGSIHACRLKCEYMLKVFVHLILFCEGKQKGLMYTTRANNMQSYGLRHAKTCLWEYADSEGTYQSAHPRSLISAFSVPLTESFDTTECINGEQMPG